MRTPALNAALERALSTPRLGRYMASSGQLLDAALSLYERNGHLSEAFHSPLQSLEVCLRNHMNARLTAAFGPAWYTDGKPPFDESTLKKLDKAMDDVQRAGKALSNGAVVAELTFGFWVTLLAPGYDQTLWRTTFFSIFRQGGRKMKRQTVHNRMDDLRKLRNRVAHHEPIYFWPLAQSHADLIEAVAWICPDSAVWAFERSRVPFVLNNP